MTELERIRSLATDIPALWHSPDTLAKDRKENVRALIERVTLTLRGTTEEAQVRILWVGGVVSEDEIIAITEYIKHLAPQEANPLNNRTSPTQIRDNEVPNIQQQNLQQNQQPAQQTPQGTRPVNPSGKKP